MSKYVSPWLKISSGVVGMGQGWAMCQDGLTEDVSRNAIRRSRLRKKIEAHKELRFVATPSRNGRFRIVSKHGRISLPDGREVFAPFSLEEPFKKLGRGPFNLALELR